MATNDYSAAAVPSADGTLDYSLGGFALDEIFRGPGKLTAVQREIAIEFIHRSEQIQLERIQCIADGAQLAAEQVQDVRLDLLEKGPEVDTTAIFLDLVIGFFLDSSIPGRIMKGFANGTFKNLVKRNEALHLENLKQYETMSERFIKSINAYDFQQFEKVQITAQQYLAQAGFWRRASEFASSSDVQKDFTAAGKLLLKGSAKTFIAKPLSIDGDTPGVSLLGSVKEFSSTNRLQVRFQYQRMVTFVRLEFMTGDLARQFLRLGEYNALDSPLKAIRDRCKRLFEAIIWAGIYGFDDDHRRLASRGDRLKGIDTRLQDYWIRRFGPDIKDGD